MPEQSVLHEHVGGLPPSAYKNKGIEDFFMNEVVLGGRISSDLAIEGKNTKYCSFGLAVKTAKKAEMTDDKEEYITDFFNLSAFGKTAELLDENFAKGDYLALRGHLDAVEYKDRGGDIKKYVRVVVDSIIFDACRKKAQN